MSTAWVAALQARQAALATAWNGGLTQTQLRAAIRAAFATFRTSRQTARATYNASLRTADAAYNAAVRTANAAYTTARKAAWVAYRSSRTSCAQINVDSRGRSTNGVVPNDANSSEGSDS